jgi:hypothetical protein
MLPRVAAAATTGIARPLPALGDFAGAAARWLRVYK